MTEQVTEPDFTPYWAADRGSPPGFLVERSTHDLGNALMSKEPYLSVDWQEKEVTNLWKRVWLMACRENDIPEPGDRLAYDIVNQSVIIVRTVDGDLRAFHNTCQHRGNRLVEGRGGGTQIQCPFHGWTWNLQGELADVPCRWDFPGLNPTQMGLPPVRLATWHGFVFITLDPDALEFDEYIGAELTRQLGYWPIAEAWKAGHVSKVVPCNWKLALEAFIESWHSARTHPQITPYFADTETQYDFYGPHARWIGPSGVPSRQLGEVDDQEIVDAMIGDAFAAMSGGGGAEPQIPQLAPGQTARELLADFVRSALTDLTGRDHSATSDSELLDGIQYFVFPNLAVFGGYGFPFVYRFSPNDDDPGSCVFEVMVLAYLAEGAPRPPDSPMRVTDPAEPWSAAPELGGLGPITDQDSTNLARLQRGVRSDGFRAVRFSNYQERNIRNFHEHLARYVDRAAG